MEYNVYLVKNQTKVFLGSFNDREDAIYFAKTQSAKNIIKNIAQGNTIIVVSGSMERVVYELFT